ncbi:hypothetical protein Sango_1240000 [Sesamum angolense]|uniref:Reverse transcriptase/retrotransposon-derived protein RNase H-like domain-containing protein n=1 Tax=Sesamum angolense TaxID=2727404 RepID=A0AAE1WQH8_9LAMI|nr:hypothetical protein Sango_1240000 [Sesamum angolense]
MKRDSIPKAFKLIIKAGYNPKEKLSLRKLPPEATSKKLHGLNTTQMMLKEKRHAIQESRVDHKRAENLRESVFNRLGPHRKALNGITNIQSIFERLGPCKRVGYQKKCAFKVVSLKAKVQTVIFTQAQSDDEDDKKSVASSNYINNGAEEDIVQIYHITLIEDGEVEEEDAEDAPAELERDEACDKAFTSIKSYLMKPPVLVAPVPERPLILYVAAEERSVGILLAQKNDEGKENFVLFE